MKSNQPSKVHQTTEKASLEEGAFNEELRDQLKGNSIGWSGEKHLGLLEALLSRLRTREGESVTLNPEQMETLRLIFQPKEDHQRTVLRQIFNNAGYVLDEDSERTLATMFSASQFADFLAKENDPETGKPFIEKQKKRGAKKSTFTSLVNAKGRNTQAPTEKENATDK